MSRKRRHRDDSPPRLWSWDEKLAALRVYRDLFGTCEVERRYSVPCGDSDWPRTMSGMDLAHAVESFRTAPTLPPSTLDALIEMGFPWRVGGGASPCVTHVKRHGGYLRVVAFDDQIDALDMYRHLYGRRAIAPMFLVPHQHANWPSTMWDVELARVPEMLARHAVELSDAQLARVHGLLFLRQIPPWPALTQLLIECERDVPIDFVVQYGSRHAGTPLGDLAWQLQRRRPQLAPLRQAWLASARISTSWKRIHEALRHYHVAYPAEPVPSTFVVRRRGWPPALRGLRLGYWTMRVLVMHRALALDASILAALTPFLTPPPCDLSGVGSDIDLTISDDNNDDPTRSDDEFDAARWPRASAQYVDSVELLGSDADDEIATRCLLSPRLDSPPPFRAPDDTETCSESENDMGMAYDADETEDEAPPAPMVLPSHPLPSTSVVATEVQAPSLPVDQPWWPKQRRPPIPLALRRKSWSMPAQTSVPGTDVCPEARPASEEALGASIDKLARPVVAPTVAWSKEYMIEEHWIEPTVSYKREQKCNKIPSATPDVRQPRPVAAAAQLVVCTPPPTTTTVVAPPSQLSAVLLKSEHPTPALPPSTKAMLDASAPPTHHKPELVTRSDRLVHDDTSEKPTATASSIAPTSEPSMPQAAPGCDVSSSSLLSTVVAAAVAVDAPAVAVDAPAVAVDAPAVAVDAAAVAVDAPAVVADARDTKIKDDASDELRMYSKWDRRLLALQVYHGLHGHVLVPSDFVVPSGDATWPSALAGFTLGAAVETIRAASNRLQSVHRYRLDVIGFVWDVNIAGLWRDVVHALERWTLRRAGRRMTDVDIVDAPASLSGGPIGKYLTRLDVDAILSLPAYQAPLLRLHFDAVARWRAKLLALETYACRFQHLHVPASFRVPTDPRWDASTWDLPLGLIVTWLRDIGAAAMAPEKAAALDHLGFEWTSIDFELLADATRLVPAPSTPIVPEELHPLGLVVAKRRAYMDRMTRAYHASVSLLLDRQAHPRPGEAVFDMSLILSTLMQYASFHGSTAVPILFTIPDDSDVWLDGAREMPLGFFVAFLHDHFDELDGLVQSLLQDTGFAQPFPHVVSGSVKVEAARGIRLEHESYAADVTPAAAY